MAKKLIGRIFKSLQDDMAVLHLRVGKFPGRRRRQSLQYGVGGGLNRFLEVVPIPLGFFFEHFDHLLFGILIGEHLRGNIYEIALTGHQGRPALWKRSSTNASSGYFSFKALIRCRAAGRRNWV